jgi:hypothetical protein
MKRMAAFRCGLALAVRREQRPSLKFSVVFAIFFSYFTEKFNAASSSLLQVTEEPCVLLLGTKRAMSQAPLPSPLTATNRGLRQPCVGPAMQRVGASERGLS